MAKFVFNGKSYNYFKHWYNETWKNDRAIEIPISFEVIKKYENILEVGNVLSHYKTFKHDIIDLYEKDIGVINEDIRTFKTDKKYDLIISISTLEHIDENDGKGEKGILDAFDNMRSLLTPKGNIFITFPIGAHVDLDNLFRNNKLGLKETYVMCRDLEDDDKYQRNIWEQCGVSDIHSFSSHVVGYELVSKGYVMTVGSQTWYLIIGKI